ncbi:hydroxyacid dehydrogenase [Egibacter rhizosphaerae]|uniref:Hydroxyacid dehydrogenase n=1 Tax=Egibacter rhizosphaerae TaxID=1670831 RepID=A0A411YCR1_9ACTN|nr:D-isomer specific 2-hydroxyacid dehydrogenase family protein [Egibacter rhizosphaerae]QBI19033.1 hydroxyacid dehydrogenase [Egibacter rhizosphaerae]
MGGPRVAVAPVGTRDYVREAVRRGGGELVDPVDAEALVWTDVADPEGLTDLLARYPDIRWVQLPWAGVEPYAAAGVFDDDHVWTCGKGVYAEPVAEHALALGLAGLRELQRYARAEGWSGEAGISLVRGRVTIFGGGGVTEHLVRLLRPFECHITVVRRHAQEIEGVDRVLDFERRYEALKGADLVVLALALTPETRSLVGQVELELMEPHAWLVNVARGGHVVTEELLEALRDDTIGGAALDVTEPEPLPDGHPLWSLPNCLITPHIANTEDMAQPLLAARIEENVRRYGEGRDLIGYVDPRLGY